MRRVLNVPCVMDIRMCGILERNGVVMKRNYRALYRRALKKAKASERHAKIQENAAKEYFAIICQINSLQYSTNDKTALARIYELTRTVLGEFEEPIVEI